MTRVVHYCRVSTVDQHLETPDGGTSARKIADTLCDPMKQAMNEAWERVCASASSMGTAPPNAASHSHR